MYLPGEVVRRLFKRPAHNLARGEKGLDLRKKYFNTILKPGSKDLRSIPVINKRGHNTCTKKDFKYQISACSDKPF